MLINVEDKRAFLVSISSFKNVALEGSFKVFITVFIKIDRTFPYLLTWVNLDNYTQIQSKVLRVQNGFLLTVSQSVSTLVPNLLLRRSMIARLAFQNSFLAQIAFPSFCFLRISSSVHGALHCCFIDLSFRFFRCHWSKLENLQNR